MLISIAKLLEIKHLTRIGCESDPNCSDSKFKIRLFFGIESEPSFNYLLEPKLNFNFNYFLVETTVNKISVCIHTIRLYLQVLCLDNMEKKNKKNSQYDNHESIPSVT